MERRRTHREAFSPPHCPNPECPHHRCLGESWNVIRYGSFVRKSDRRRVPRFRCMRCRRTFSSQTFSSTYWLKRPRDYLPIIELLVGGSCLRQIARNRRTTHATVGRHLARAGRHCLLYHARPRVPIDEPIAIDGIETFEHSQFFPHHFNLAVGFKTWCIYSFTDSPLRRSGRMTPEQKERREVIEATLGRPDPKAVEKDVAELIEILARVTPPTKPLRLLSDEHQAYPRSIRRVRTRFPHRSIVHETTPSTDPRTRANALFPINLADLLIRHSCADHKRETIAFPKRRLFAALRLAIHVVWRAYIKRRRENGGLETAAMRAALADRPLSFAEIFSRRLFRTLTELPERWSAYYDHAVSTPACLNETRHQLRYAY